MSSGDEIPPAKRIGIGHFGKRSIQFEKSTFEKPYGAAQTETTVPPDRYHSGKKEMRRKRRQSGMMLMQPRSRPPRPSKSAHTPTSDRGYSPYDRFYTRYPRLPMLSISGLIRTRSSRICRSETVSFASGSEEPFISSGISCVCVSGRNDPAPGTVSDFLFVLSVFILLFFNISVSPRRKVADPYRTYNVRTVNPIRQKQKANPCRIYRWQRRYTTVKQEIDIDLKFRKKQISDLQSIL